MSLQPEQRKWAMGVLAQADGAALAALWAGWPDKPAFTWLRKPETGLVMVRGRAGGAGSPFNLGEMTVTRCALTLDDGTVGHAYVQGRSAEQAEVAALVDALHQREADREAVRQTFLLPLDEARQAARQQAAAETAATKVEFFTMVRGDN